MRLITPSAMAGMLLLCSIAAAEEPPMLEQETDRINYSLGHQIGADFKRQGVALDSAAVRQGMEDALAGTAPRLPGDEMEQRLRRLKGQITDDMRSSQAQRVMERKAEAERKRLEASNFLAQNSGKPGVVTLASGLQYRVIRSGDGGSPTLRDRVTIHYRGSLIGGREYDSSYRKQKPVTTRVADMILGIREAVQLMQPGAKWQLFIPPDLAYGRDSPLAHQAVIVELELLAVEAGNGTDPASAGPGDTPGDQQP